MTDPAAIAEVAATPLYRIIGFCDVPDKPAGNDFLTYFRDEHRFDCAALPTRSALAIYAAERGYWPSGKRGAHPQRCDPVYFIIGDVPHRVRPRVGAA